MREYLLLISRNIGGICIRYIILKALSSKRSSTADTYWRILNIKLFTTHFILPVEYGVFKVAKSWWLSSSRRWLLSLNRPYVFSSKVALICDCDVSTVEDVVGVTLVYAWNMIEALDVHFGNVLACKLVFSIIEGSFILITNVAYCSWDARIHLTHWILHLKVIRYSGKGVILLPPLKHIFKHYNYKLL